MKIVVYRAAIILMGAAHYVNMYRRATRNDRRCYKTSHGIITLKKG